MNTKMSTEEISNLKQCVKMYRDLDNQIRELNKEVQSKREDRKIIEMDIADIMKLPQFSGIDKLKIDDDNSTIKIARPGTYNKPWSLSKKELDVLLRSYFSAARAPNADECINYILEERRKALIGKEFDFSRVIPEE
jgi:hypothetical protein